MSAELTVIIPTWNRIDLLRHCLESLLRQSVSAHILVVDNGSNDGTPEILKREYRKVECLAQTENLGFARAVNLGILTTKTPYLALLNNDTEAAPDWIECGLSALLHRPEYAFFASRMLHFEHRSYLDGAGDCYDRFGMPYKRGYGESAEHYDRVEPVLGASAGAAFYRRSLFDQVGLFEEVFYMYLEDVEFSLRCQLLGQRCLYLPQARVYHMEAASDVSLNVRKANRVANHPKSPIEPLQSVNRVYWITRNRWLLMLMYQPLRHLPFLTFGWAKSLAFHIFKGGFAGAFLRGLLSTIGLTSWAVQRRRELRKARLISDDDLCRLLRKC